MRLSRRRQATSGTSSSQQPQELHCLRVEHGDDRDGDEVIDDGEGEQEGPQRARQVRADDGEHRQSEGDVGGRGDGPTPQHPTDVGAAVASGEREHGDDEQHGGQDDAADRGRDRQRRLAAVGEVPGDELTLQLDAGDEEEDREQPVGRPRAEGEIEVQRRRADDGVAQRRIRLSPRRIGPDERGDRSDEQDGATDGLGAEQVGDVARLAPGAAAEERRLARAGVVAHRWSLRSRCHRTPTRLPGTPWPRAAMPRATTDPIGTYRKRAGRKPGQALHSAGLGCGVRARRLGKQ